MKKFLSCLPAFALGACAFFSAPSRAQDKPAELSRGPDVRLFLGIIGPPELLKRSVLGGCYVDRKLMGLGRPQPEPTL